EQDQEEDAIGGNKDAGHISNHELSVRWAFQPPINRHRTDQLLHHQPLSESALVCSSWHHPREPPLFRVLQFRLLDGAGRINVLGTDLGALADESALPDAFTAGDYLGPVVFGAVA